MVQDSKPPDGSASVPNNGRVQRRVTVAFEVEFHARGTEGSGVVTAVSLTCALIDEAEPLLLAGAEVKLRFSFFEDSTPVEVRADEIRETKAGFAVRFKGLDSRIKSVLALAIRRLAGESASHASLLGRRS